MMIVASTTVRPPSTSTGIFCSGHSAAHSATSPGRPAQHAVLERRVVLVQRDQHLLAVRRERMCVEDEAHAETRVVVRAAPLIGVGARVRYRLSEWLMSLRSRSGALRRLLEDVGDSGLVGLENSATPSSGRSS